MAQCKAETVSGSQCVSEAAPPSRTLCMRHRTMVASGKAVINVDTGRKFPVPAAGTAAQALAPIAKGRAAQAATSSGNPRSAAVAARGRRTATAIAEVEEPRAARGPGQHPSICDATRCRSLALPGSDYCMKHQGLA